MSEFIDVVCFGGPLDGEVHHRHADPPFGYRAKYVTVDEEKRKYFLYNRINRKRLCSDVLSAAVRNVHATP